MDAFRSFLDSESDWLKRLNYDWLKNLSQISPLVQTHLKRVYLSLCCSLVAGLVGVYLHTLWNIGGLLTSIGTIGGIIWLHSIPPHHEQKKFSLLMVTTLLHGATNGPLTKLMIDINPSIPVSVFVGCALAFACFSGAAVLARRREYFYLGALLSSALSILFCVHFASSVFGGSTILVKFAIYFGFLLFLGYIVVETQDIIDKACRGDLDYAKHAINLSTEFLAVFVWFLKLENAADKEEEVEGNEKLMGPGILTIE